MDRSDKAIRVLESKLWWTPKMKFIEVYRCPSCYKVMARKGCVLFSICPSCGQRLCWRFYDEIDYLK